MPGSRTSHPLLTHSDVVELWSLRQDTLVEFPADGEDDMVLMTRWGDVRVPGLDDILCRTVERMSYGPVSLSNVVPTFGTPGAGAEAARLTRLLDTLQSVVVRSLATDTGRLLLSVVPISAEARFAPRQARDDVVHRLSRFASLRVEDGGLCIESPLSAVRVSLHDVLATWLAGCFSRPTSVREATALLGVPASTVRTAVGYLAEAGLLVRGEPQQSGDGWDFAEDRDPALVDWSPYDLMMHARSRLGRHDGPSGATCEPNGTANPEPAVLPPRPAGTTALPYPRLDQVLAEDPPVTLALEALSMVRSYGDYPLTLSQVGKLLYRCARVRSFVADPAGDPYAAMVTDRPYPSLGATYALELYLTVSRCEGLSRGSYHYDPVHHTLRRVEADPALVDALLAQAQETAQLTGEPPLLITTTARFRRATRKYSGFAYSALLKDVGALHQTLYLVCTAMGLAPCALSTGDSDLAARALGLDWRTESSIGEFVLGTLPTGREERPERTVPVNGYDWRRRCVEALRRIVGQVAR